MTERSTVHPSQAGSRPPPSLYPDAAAPGDSLSSSQAGGGSSSLFSPAAVPGPNSVALLCEDGALPATLPGRAALAESIAKHADFLPVATAIFLASTRAKFFPAREQAGAFLEWCNAAFAREMNPAHVHHMIAVGALLLFRAQDKVWAPTLCALTMEKLLPLTRLSSEQLTRFLEENGHALGDASREEIRDMVSDVLGEKKHHARTPHRASVVGPTEIAIGFADMPADRIYATADAMRSDQSLRLLKNSMVIAERQADQGQYSPQDLVDAMSAVKSWFQRIVPLAEKAGIAIE